MKVTVETKDGFVLAGIMKHGIESQQCPAVWDELFDKHCPEQLEKLGDGKSFGVCIDVPNRSGIDYMAAYDTKDVIKAKELGLDILNVTEQEYVVVPIRGAVPTSIHRGWDYVYTIYFPETGYSHADAPSFEVYSEGDMTQDSYEMEIWIPMIK